ncbi:hypothetical protein WQE_22783 [Paraburkholderia hospita]|uniref:Uncharacterized protein n=1 Tax=Paraburkholderia hospita TaxID=169430 RepID=A0ABP2PPU5_9BURK|nr:hypothetical protein [Paraburkholderia hospita]EIM98686.1 hypothetical protein WQE_22783 [Paraburkholderia hospita]OUL87657.1 hypothetical protein CA602_13035 [Paraburkholderia hospita]
MDIREIQRLHAQFAPDSMVIDLPRQIAALPAPSGFSDGTRPPLTRQSPERYARARWAKAGPLARGAVIAIAAALVVGMAGMGAASIYTGYRANHHDPVVAAQTQKPADSTTPAVEARTAPAFAEIDATPAHPVSAAPTLSASDFALAASMGLTADQFRNSLKATPRSTGAAAPALSTEAQQAAVSPIHRDSTRRDSAAPAAPAIASQPQQLATPAPAPTSGNPERAKVQPKPTITATVAAETPPPTAAPSVDAEKPVRPVHRHVSRPRAEASDTDSTPKPAAANRAGSAEVQMF